MSRAFNCVFSIFWTRVWNSVFDLVQPISQLFTSPSPTKVETIFQYIYENYEHIPTGIDRAPSELATFLLKCGLSSNNILHMTTKVNFNYKGNSLSTVVMQQAGAEPSAIYYTATALYPTPINSKLPFLLVARLSLLPQLIVPTLLYSH